MSMHLFEFLLFLIVSHFGLMSSNVTLLESPCVLAVTQFESLLVSHFASQTETETTYPGRAGTLTGLHPMQVCRCRRPPHPVTFRRSSSTRCGFGAAPAFVCGRPVTGAARPDGGRM